MYPYPPPLPQQLLADSRWRFRNSLWTLAAFLGCGMFTWISFGYIGFKARNRVWQACAVCYALAFAGLMVAMEFSGPSDDEVAAGAVRTPTEQAVQNWVAGAIVAIWVGGMVHAMLVRPRWLVWRAHHSGAWWEQAVPAPIVPVYAPPAPAAPTRVDLSTEVDVNTAGEEEFRTLGLPEDVVAELISRRRTTGGFATVQEFAAAAGLKPHELAQLLPRIRIPNAQTPTGFQPTARRLDL